MKGVVFTEFFDLVEDKFGLEVVEKIIEKAELANEGAYVATGSYSHFEIVKLVTLLSEESGVDAPALIKAFGHHLFQTFLKSYPMFFEGESTVSFLSKVDEHIHVEVRKLYPDAELPKFDYEKGTDLLKMHYTSSRPFADLAEGLIEASVQHFKENVTLEVEKTGADSPNSRLFVLRNAA